MLCFLINNTILKLSSSSENTDELVHPEVCGDCSDEGASSNALWLPTLERLYPPCWLLGICGHLKLILRKINNNKAQKSISEPHLVLSSRQLTLEYLLTGVVDIGRCIACSLLYPLAISCAISYSSSLPSEFDDI